MEYIVAALIVAVLIGAAILGGAMGRITELEKLFLEMRRADGEKFEALHRLTCASEHRGVIAENAENIAKNAEKKVNELAAAIGMEYEYTISKGYVKKGKK